MMPGTLLVLWKHCQVSWCLAGVLQADDARLTQLRCHTSKDGHVFRKFTWGNRKSLYDGPRKEGFDIQKEIKAYYG